jgi:hypothetical protein
MVSSKAVCAVVMMLVVVAASVPVAYAGGGGAGLGGVTFLQCWVIEGVNPPHLLSVNDQFSDATFARVGKARLLCTLADGIACTDEKDAEGNLLMPECRGRVSPTLDNPGGALDHLTCYERDDNNDERSRAVVTLTDPFGSQTVRVGGPRFLCSASNKECLPDPRTGEVRCPIVDPAPAP